MMQHRTARCRSHRPSEKAGFTLAELMGVVLIMGLIAGVVSVNFMATLPRAQLNSTIHDISAAVSGARSDAIARNGEFRIYYDIDSDRFHVKSPFKVGGGLAQREEDRVIVKRGVLPEHISFVRITIDGIEYNEGIVFASFNPLGSATGHTINLMSAPNEDITTVEVLPLTGLVRFHYMDFQRDMVTEDDFD